MSEFLSAMTMVLDQTLDTYEETRNWKTLEAILRKFLWNDTLAQHWERCWRRAMHRRSRVR
jgi:hypothetical protein